MSEFAYYCIFSQVWIQLCIRVAIDQANGTMDISGITVSPESSIIEAINTIEKGHAQIVLVVDAEYRLLGTVTDGDVRRAILQQIEITAPVNTIMNTNFRFANKPYKRVDLLAVMKRDKIHQLPIITESGRLEDLLLLEDILSSRNKDNPVVIMAGGKGKRMLPYTESCPKPMLHVQGKPMLQILIEQSISYGFRKFYISVNYKKEVIMEYFRDGSDLGVSIEYLIEDIPLGTAGSLKLLPHDIKNPFLVLNGDVLTRLDHEALLNYHSEAAHGGATMCVREHTVDIPFGVVTSKNEQLDQIIEKPTYKFLVNAGVYVIDPGCLDLIKRSVATDMPAFLDLIKDSNRQVMVCPIHEYWIDVGRPEALSQVNSEW